MKKQNIEDVFSSMENFSSVPPPELWAQIEDKLDKPKKKKRAIIWWSAAAILVIGLSVPTVFYISSGSQNTISNQNNVVLEENENSNSNKNETEKIQNSNSNSTLKNSNIVSPEKANKTVVQKNKNSNSNKSETDKFQNSNNNSILKNSNIVSPEKSNKAVVSNDSQTNSSGKNISSTQKKLNNTKATGTIPKNQNQNLIFEEKMTSAKNIASNEGVIKESPKKKSSVVNTAKSNTKNTQEDILKTNKNPLSEDQINIVENKNIADVSITKSNIENNSINKSDKNQFNSTKLLLTEQNFTDASKTNSKNNKSTQIDSIQLLELQNLEKGLAINSDKKDTKEDKPKSNLDIDKWSLEVFAGVMNSQNLKNEKALGNNIDSKQSNAYGVKTNYKLNKKWEISSGLSINELGQSIADVSYLSGKSNTLVVGESFTQSKSSPRIVDNSDYVFITNNTRNMLVSENFENGNIDQRLKYLEMPIEISYSLFNRNKTNISLNTGGFVGKLISNDVFLDGNSIGNNLEANEFVYGSVLSSTLQYRLYKKTNIFIEPGMNYYFNPLENQPFNQFQWSFNFGLNVAF
jgi:hypothetical protein